MKQLIFKLLSIFVSKAKPYFRWIAEQCDIALYHPWSPQGDNTIIFADDLEIVKHRIPKSVYFNTASGNIYIGKGAVFGENVMLLTGMHLNIFQAKQTGEEHHAVPKLGRDINIGEGCYVGSGAIIIGPCKIGKFAVVGAGTIVTKDVPERTMVIGATSQRYIPIEKQVE